MPAISTLLLTAVGFVLRLAVGDALKPVPVGTELNILQERVPEVTAAEACYLGWQESLTLLAKLVEVDIPA